LFSGGETVTFTAAGADVPAFTASVAMPSKLQITSPAKPSDSSPVLAVDREQGFAFSWSGGGSGQAMISLFDSSGARVTCSYPAASGSATVPAAALAQLGAGTGGGFAMAAISTNQVVVGEWGIDAEGYYNAVWPDDSIVSGGATLQ